MTSSQIFTGQVTSVKIEQFDDPYNVGYGFGEREYYTVKVKINLECLILGQSTNIEFYSPGVTKSVTYVVGCPIATVIIDTNSFIGNKYNPEGGQGPKGVFGIQEAYSKINVGDTISIKGRLKQHKKVIGGEIKKF